MSHGQAVAIGRHHPHMATVYFQQQAIKVITNILLGHGKRRGVQHPAQFFLRQLQAEAFRLVFHVGKVLSRQGRQGKMGVARSHVQTVTFQRQINRGFVTECPTDIRQLPGRYRDPARLVHVDRRNPPDQFNFHIGTGECQCVVFSFQQHVGQDRHGLFLFHNASNALQRSKKGFTAYGQFHGTRLQLSEVNVVG